MKWLAVVLSVSALCAQDPSPDRVRAAALKSIALLQKGSVGFAKAQDCFSCHHAGLPARALSLARERGFTVDEAAARASIVKGLTYSPDLRSIDRMVQANMIIDPSTSEASALIAAHGAGVKASLTTTILARQIARSQRPNGQWLTIDERPPQGHSQFTATALATHAMMLYMPEELRKEAFGRADRARQWLLEAKPVTTEDYTYRLVGLAWAGAPESQRAGALQELRALQRPNGGWAQLPTREPDAYATGEALVALADAGGVSPTDPAWRKGLQYLLSTQNPDGSWHVQTRMVSPAQVSPPYFETGFPYGHDQFISSAGSSYATMALLLALPKSDHPIARPALSELEPKDAKPWMHTALFGTVSELQGLLDRGLDLKSQTAYGTTLLMMTAPDAAKMKLLIDRGADVNARSKSGYTALMVASIYRGSGDALQLLFSKGANAQFGTGVMFNASPLVLAAYAGDPALITLLHSKGADVNRRMMLLGAFPTSPLAMAVNFGEVDTIKVLVAAGADIKEHDPDGLSLVHMAALTNHTEAAQALIAAGAPFNDADKHGFTPLMYASTVNFGDDRMVQALLKAGADTKAKAKTGETALSQAKRFHYQHIQAALEKAGAR